MSQQKDVKPRVAPDRTGPELGRRAWASAVDSGRRAKLAFHVYRGDRLVYERRPADYVAALLRRPCRSTGL